MSKNKTNGQCRREEREAFKKIIENVKSLYFSDSSGAEACRLILADLAKRESEVQKSEVGQIVSKLVKKWKMP